MPEMEGVQREIREKLESVPPPKPITITTKDGGVTVVVAEEGGGGEETGKRENETELGESASKRRGKIMSDDVCFHCKTGEEPVMGSDLLVCALRDCPKVCHRYCSFHPKDDWYDPALLDGWNCGWHTCICCAKSARYMCYTCSTSYCKSCINDKYFSCVRGSKGFCERCMLRVDLIEKNELGNYLAEKKCKSIGIMERNFEDYYVELRKKLSLSWSEIAVPKISSKDDEEGSDSDDPMLDVVTVRLEGRYVSRLLL